MADEPGGPGARGAHAKGRSLERDAADKLERAVAAVIAEGKNVTYDMKPHRDDPTAVGTSAMADAIIGAMEGVQATGDR